MRKALGVIVVLLILGGGYWYWSQKKAEETKLAEPQVEEEKQPAEEGEQEKKTGEQTTTSPQPSPSPGEGVNAVQEISMTTGGFFFSPKEITLKKGRPVKITIQNSGRHTFTIDELGINKALSDGANVVEFTPDSAGVFIYYCATPGHRLLGQYGTVTVEE